MGRAAYHKEWPKHSTQATGQAGLGTPATGPTVLWWGQKIGFMAGYRVVGHLENYTSRNLVLLTQIHRWEAGGGYEWLKKFSM
jgi:hypothetical protein